MLNATDTLQKTGSSLGIQALYAKHELDFIWLSAFLLPLKLSVFYALFLPGLAIWALRRRAAIAAIFAELQEWLLPFAFFVLAAVLAAFFGIQPLRSLRHITTLGFFGLAILFFYDAGKNGFYLKLIAAALLGQTLAAYHSVLEAAFPTRVPAIFLGKMTESGQISLTLLTALGFGCFCAAAHSRPSATSQYAGLGFLSFALFTGLAFSSKQAPWIQVLLLICAHVPLVWQLVIYSKDSAGRRADCSALVLTIALPLMATALLVNLKRGPWAGVLLASLAWLWIFKRRLLLPGLLFACLLFVSISPLRTRLILTPDHFYISGGRSLIWEIGAELCTRFPLGIGYRNSSIMQQFSPEIPSHLKHFHNNLLNVVVGCGWIGLSMYCWAFFALIGRALRTAGMQSQSARILSASLGCALLSWQIAGLVEYNFGDSEVVLLSCVLIACLARLHKEERTERRAPA